MEAVRELTLHIGLPKTATTTLQTHIFPQLPGYLGKYYGSDRLTRGALFVSGGEALSQWIKGSPRWPRAVEAWVESLGELGEAQPLLSDEALARWPSELHGPSHWPLSDGWSDTLRVRPHPVIELLEAVRAAGRSNDLRVRVIVTLRNQPEFMGSLYAQLQGGMQRPGQADFEAKVEESLRRDDPFFDYASLVEELQQVVGGTDLLVLLHEDGLERNVARIAEFLDLPLRATGLTRENVKSESAQAWKGAWTDLPVTRRGPLGSLRKAVDRRWPNSLGTLAPPLKRMLAGVDAASARVVKPKRHEGVRIELSDELAERIRRHYGPSNERLALLLGRDLKALGY